MNKLSLLYLDDEEINLIMFKEMFKRDFDIVTTSSPEEAIKYLKENEVDLVITDQLMPNLTGLEFLQHLAEEIPNSAAKRVMISGYTTDGEINEALDNELLDKFVSKPWKYEELRDALIALKN